MNNKTSRFDRVYIGLILGLMLPILVFYLYYLIRHYHKIEFGFFISMLHQYRLIFKVMSLCVLADLPLFYAFIQFKFWRTSRGIVMACFIFAFAVAAYQLFT